MIRLIENGIYLIQGKQALEVKDTNVLWDLNGQTVDPEQLSTEEFPDREKARKNTMAYQILSRHNASGNMDDLKIRFDALTSHDITYVGIVQTARASGLKEFPIPYVLTNCQTVCRRWVEPSTKMIMSSVCLRLKNTAGSMFLPIKRSSINI